MSNGIAVSVSFAVIVCVYVQVCNVCQVKYVCVCDGMSAQNRPRPAPLVVAISTAIYAR